MDVGTNKTRKDTRAVVSLVARYRSPSTFEYVEEACCDVSLGGMFIRSKDPAPAGTLLKLECESGTDGQIRGVARVVWLRTEQNEYGPSGMGVKFVKLDPESRDVIMRIVQELAAAGIESPSMSSAPEQRGKPPTKRPAADGAASSAQPMAADASQARQEPQLTAAAAAEAHSLAMASTQLAPLMTSDTSTARESTDGQGRSSKPPVPSRSSKPPASRPPADRAAGMVAKETAQVWRVSDRSSDAGTAVASGRPAKSPPPPPPPARSTPSAALARASSGALVTDASAARQQRGRDFAKDGLELAPLQPVLRVARSSRSAPPPSDHSGRAFWLVAVAVVALSGIVAIFSMRAAREDAQPDSAGHQANAADQADKANAADQADKSEANADTRRSARASGEEPAAKDEPAQPTAAEGSEHALAQPADAVAALPSAVTQAPGATTAADTQAAHDSPPPAAQPEATPQAVSGSPPTAAEPGSPAQATAQTQPSAASNASAQSSGNPSTSGANTGSAASNVNAQPSAAASSTADSHPQPSAAAPAPKPATNPPPALGPGEIAHIVTFTSRPSGASIFVGDQQTLTPGELNLGAMPAKIRVTAQKEGYEPSTVWINPTAEFQKVGAVMRREAHFVLKELPAAPNANAPSSTPAPQRGGATAPATPAPSSATAVPQTQNAAPSSPSSASSTQSNPQPAVTAQAPSAPSANPEPAAQQP